MTGAVAAALVVETPTADAIATHRFQLPCSVPARRLRGMLGKAAAQQRDVIGSPDTSGSQAAWRIPSS